MFRARSLRRLTPVALVAASALALTSCGDDGDKKSASKTTDDPSASASSAEDCGDFSSGKTSESVKVTGDFGKAQTAEFETPLKAAGVERTLLTQGDGDDTASGDTIDALLSVYLGKDGKALGTQRVPITAGDPAIPEAFTAAVDCVPIGSRVVVTASAEEIYGEQGNPNLGVAAEDSLVIVTDVVGLKAELKPEAWKDAPKVSFADDGKPTVKLPDIVPPSRLLLKVLRAGEGDVVKKGDTVTLDYQGTSWNTGKIFDQSYGKAPASFATDQVVEGFGAALVGQKVGTRLIVSIPPRYAYGEQGSGQQLSGQTLVFVIDIQKTAAPE